MPEREAPSIDVDPSRRGAPGRRRIYEAQPALPDRFYYAWSRSKQTVIAAR